ADEANPQMTTELVEFRIAMDEYLGDMIINSEALSGNNSNVSLSLQESRGLLTELTATELTQMKKAFDRNPAAWEVNKNLNALIDHQERTRAARKAYLQKSADAVMSRNDMTVIQTSLVEYSDDYDNGCPGTVPMGAVIPIAIITMALEGVNDAINDGLAIIILGAGATIPNPVKIITSIAFFVSKLTLNSMEWARDVADDCENDDHRTYLREVVGRTQSKYTPKKEMKITTEYVGQTVDKGQIKYNFVVYITEDGKPTNASITSIYGSTLNLPIGFADMNTYQFLQTSEGIYQLTVDEPTHLRGVQRLRFTVKHTDAGVEHFGVGMARTKKDTF
ncbi:MAG: hypothetical protein MJK04_02940, partial [Psychrosphaera sp.]|nr:hypothetical protein [Psychrosphaera sp.]